MHINVAHTHKRYSPKVRAGIIEIETIILNFTS